MGKKIYDYGMIGLGTMGRNLVFNMCDHGYTVAGFDKDLSKVETLEQEKGNYDLFGTHSVKEFTDALKKPRVILLLVPAGLVVDSVINKLKPLMSKDDMIIDCGNSHYTDTNLRIKKLEKEKIHFMGVGISGGESGAREKGTKFSPVYRIIIEPDDTARFRLRISRKKDLQKPLGQEYDIAFINSKKEADDFYKTILPVNLSPELTLIAKQAYAGMLWNKQFYYYDVMKWLQGDKGQPSPPKERLTGRNSSWKHLNNRDVISVPERNRRRTRCISSDRMDGTHCSINSGRERKDHKR